jgi:hypothetical chaperone protein
LVADFGGGTCDFCVFRLHPDAQLDRTRDVLATGGVRVGGTDFDARIMWERVVDHLGRGTTYESWGKHLDVPLPLFQAVCRWENISSLRTPRALEELRFIRSGADDRPAINRLYRIITEDLGLELLTAVEAAKCELSTAEVSTIRFEHQGDAKRALHIEQALTEAELQLIIGAETDRIIECLEDTLREANVLDEEVDVCFMTGGSSLVRVLRDYFDARFGSEAVRRGDAFVSVATGLLQEAVARAREPGG